MNPTESKRLFEAYDRAANKIKAPKSSASDEVSFGIAYQDLVKAGLAMQLKRKYSKR